MRKSLTKKLCVVLFSVLTIHFLFVFAKVEPKQLLSAARTSFFSDTTLTTDSVSGDISNSNIAIADNSVDAVSSDVNSSTSNLYTTLNLSGLGLSRLAFDNAIKGYSYLLAKGKLQNKNVLSIVDFSLPSSKKRLFVLDMNSGKLLFNTYVSHGRNSGTAQASSFSNEPESFKSSLGFYITRDTYDGKHGFSLRLDGQDKGFNDKALSRAIVMHTAPYVDENLIRSQGYIGRSLGCPAIPEKLHKPIIEKIKNGSCLFLFSPDRNYALHSTVLNKAV